MLYITGCLLKIKLKRCKEVKEKTHTQLQEMFSQLSCKTCCSVARDYIRLHGDESSSHPRAERDEVGPLRPIPALIAKRQIKGKQRFVSRLEANY